jgi:hypothetical protein
MSDRQALLTGGCQCGAVRYALYARPATASICHCRMCQKAFGSYLAPLAGVNQADFTWTRGEPGLFCSSAAVERGFCRDCGTPLSFRYVQTPVIDVSLGSLDDPTALRPTVAYGLESRVPWFDTLASLPGRTTADSLEPGQQSRVLSRQHPDHDTSEWPAGGEKDR